MLSETGLPELGERYFCARAVVWDFYTTGTDKGIVPLKEKDSL